MLENWDVFFCLILFGETNLLGVAAVSFSAGGAGDVSRHRSRSRQLEGQHKLEVRRVPCEQTSRVRPQNSG